jgi:hypothetical protein
MSLISMIERLATQTNELDRVKAVVKAGADVLTRAGMPTKVSFGKLRKGKKAKAGSGKKAKKVRRKADGTYYLEGAEDIDFSDIDFADIDFADIDFSDEGGPDGDDEVAEDTTQVIR